jgi:hypothetical protein
MSCTKGIPHESVCCPPQELMINPGPMRRREPRRTMHQLYGLRNRVQDTYTEAEEDGHEEGD